ncbi:MAG TPA: redoxin domain-containing protein [Acidimicrobiia bacterium]|jgi:peroxiredoxin
MATSSSPLSVGGTAPAFRAPTSNGQTLDSDAYLLKLPVALFFVDGVEDPDDQLLISAFDALLPQFGELRIQLLGVVPLTAKAARDYAESRFLALTLLADEDRSITDAYCGAPGAVDAHSVIVDRLGTVAAIVPRREVREHAADLLATARRARARDSRVSPIAGPARPAQ